MLNLFRGDEPGDKVSLLKLPALARISQSGFVNWFIHTYLDQELTLIQLASIAAMSPAYFSTQFKVSMGLAPHQYVIEQRIEKAKQLLLQGNCLIGEVALQVGFCDQSHLIRHMRRLLGITPKTLLRTHH